MLQGQTCLSPLFWKLGARNGCKCLVCGHVPPGVFPPLDPWGNAWDIEKWGCERRAGMPDIVPEVLSFQSIEPDSLKAPEAIKVPEHCRAPGG